MNPQDTDQHLRRYAGKEVRAALGRPWPIVPCRSLRVVNPQTGEITVQKKPARGAAWKQLQGLAASDEYVHWEAPLWAFVTGAGTGVVVLDADTDEALHGLEPHVGTGRGLGGHVYVKHPGWPVKTQAGVLPGLDVRGDGGLAYFYGASLKGPYRLLRDVEPYDVSDLPEVVARAAGLLEPPAPRARGGQLITPSDWDADGFGTPGALLYLQQRCEAIQAAPDGEWNSTFHRAVFGIAGVVATGQLDEGHARDMLFGACDDPIEAEPVFESSWAAGYDVPRPASEPRPARDDSYSLDAIGVAQRFVAQHSDEVRFVADMGVWIVWDGRRWKLDTKPGRVQELAKQTVVGLHDEATEALKAGDQDRYRTLVGLVKRMAERLDMIQRHAASDPAVQCVSEDLDAVPYLLNCANGTVDLRTGELQDHDPRDLITRITKQPYRPSEGASEWQAFLERVQPDAELRGYLQRLMGYTLIGGVTYHVVPFLEGPPRSGKSTFVEACLSVCGDYAVTASVDLFLHGGDSKYEMARLRGARLIGMSEFDEHARVNTQLLKRVTGGDTVPAREIYGTPFQFKPQGTIWVSTNHMPWLGSDDGGWVRVRRIPFTTSFLGNEDTELPGRLANDPAVLAWIVQGAVTYLRDGLQEPDSVMIATEEVKQSQDIVARFVDEQCHRVEGAETPAGDLYSSFQMWCARNGEKGGTSNRFGRRLTSLGYGAVKRNSVAYRIGLTLTRESLKDVV